MINKIDLRSLKNAEFLSFFNTLLGYVSGNTTVSAAVSAVKAVLANIISRINELFKTDPASALTDKLIALDAERDSYISGLTKICDGYRNSPDAAEQEAATLLYRNIEVYGGAEVINDMGINAETATVTSLIGDWTDKPELAAAVKTLGLSGWVTALETANENYRTTYDDRTSQTAAATTTDKVKGKRAEAINAWYGLRKKIEANRELATDTAEWDKVIGQINTLTGQYNTTLAARSSRAAKKDKDDKE